MCFSDSHWLVTVWKTYIQRLIVRQVDPSNIKYVVGRCRFLPRKTRIKLLA